MPSPRSGGSKPACMPWLSLGELRRKVSAEDDLLARGAPLGQTRRDLRHIRKLGGVRLCGGEWRNVPATPRKGVSSFLGESYLELVQVALEQRGKFTGALEGQGVRVRLLTLRFALSPRSAETNGRVAER
jgi:hypothetical protein